LAIKKRRRKVRDCWKNIWPWIQEVAGVIWKYWRPTIGSLFALVTAWMYLAGQIDFQTAAGALTILWIGGYVNRRLDFSAISKIFKDTKDDPTKES
jgi:hypothetical protein